MTQFDQRSQQVEYQFNAGRDIHIHEPPLVLSEARQRLNRKRMLRRVRANWITDVLEPSLHDGFIALRLQEKTDAVDNVWEGLMQEAKQALHLLPSYSNILQAYDDANGEMLILGEPGAGKTTLILEITRHLLLRAEKDMTQPIPVVFLLSSWSSKRLPVDEWLEEELYMKYQVPRTLAHSWVTNDQIIPLLDGLDEVKTEYRAACIAAINTYRRDHMIPLVVCARSAEYTAQPARLQLQRAIIIQSLTLEQIHEYLTHTHKQGDLLRNLLDNDPVLQELAKTPLMLNILRLACEEKPFNTVGEGDSAVVEQQILATYVQRMFARRSAQVRYTESQAIRWLMRLARQMQRQGQSVFYMEQMQFDWLDDHRLRQIYQRLAVMLPAIFIGMLVSLLILTFFVGTVYGLPLQLIYAIFGGLVGGLLVREPRLQNKPRLVRGFAISLFTGKNLLNGCIVGLSYGLIYGITSDPSKGFIYGSVFGLVSCGLSAILEKRNQAPLLIKTDSSFWRNAWRKIVNVRYLKNGFIVGVSYALGYVLSTEITHQLHTNQLDVLAYALFYSVNFALIGILLTIIFEGRTFLIQPAEIIVWSWKRFWRSLVNISRIGKGLGIGLLVGGFGGLSVWLRNNSNAGVLFVLNAAFIFGFAYWLLLGILNGLSSTTLDEQHRLSPNQGMRRSAYNGIIIGCVSGIICWCVCNLGYALTYTLQYGLYFGILVVIPKIALSVGLVFGLASGILCGLLNGGLASIQHYILRFLLMRTGSVPWYYPRFLDYAYERILLRKVGGGYMFIHRLLLDYFADLNADGSAASTAVPSSPSPTL